MVSAHRRAERPRTRATSIVAVAAVALFAVGCGARVHGADLAATDPTMTGPTTVAAVPESAAIPVPVGEPVAAAAEIADEPSSGAESLVPADATPDAKASAEGPVVPAGQATDTSVASAPVAVARPAGPPGAPATVPTPSGPATAPAGGDPAAALAEAIRRADGLTYHATYRGQATAADGSTTAALVEIWNRPGATSRTLTVSMGGQRLTTRQYRTASGRLVCIGAGTPASCKPVPGSGADDGAAIAGAVDPASGPITAMTGSVDGIPATCFHAADATASRTEACFDADGVPLVIADGNMRVVRTALDAQVTDGDVALPAS